MKRRRPIKHRPTRWEKDQSIHMTYLKEGLSQSLREDVQVMTFGKYKGKRVTEVDQVYLMRMMDSMDDCPEYINEELVRRALNGNVNSPSRMLPTKVGFACRTDKHDMPHGATHIWDGHDTVCRMYSTGGLRVERYSYFIEAPTKVCKNCLTHENYSGHESLAGEPETTDESWKDQF